MDVFNIPYDVCNEENLNNYREYRPLIVRPKSKNAIFSDVGIFITIIILTFDIFIF